MSCHESHRPKLTVAHGSKDAHRVSVHAYCAAKSSSVYVWINGVCVTFRIPKEWPKVKK